MNMRNQQNGFGVVEALVIIVLVGLVAFVGWKVYESQISTPLSTGSTQNTDQQQAKQVEEEKYAVYINPEFGYAFQYPKGWKTSDEAAKMFESPDSPAKYSITIESQDLETTNEGIGYHLTKGAHMYAYVEPTTFVTPDAYFNRNGFLPAVAKDKKEVTLDGVTALNYWFSYESSNQLITTAIKNGKLYSVIMSYSDDAALAAYRSDYDTLVASFDLPE